MADKKSDSADKKSDSGKVKLVMTVSSHNLPRLSEVEVDKETADRLIANGQAREA
jgi:hypothetical protein